MVLIMALFQGGEQQGGRAASRPGKAAEKSNSFCPLHSAARPQQFFYELNLVVYLEFAV